VCCQAHYDSWFDRSLPCLVIPAIKLFTDVTFTIPNINNFVVKEIFSAWLTCNFFEIFKAVTPKFIYYNLKAIIYVTFVHFVHNFKHNLNQVAAYSSFKVVNSNFLSIF
jgi:hypothetical protein